MVAKPITTTRDRLHELMTTLNLTQTNICKRTGIKKSAMSHYVNGRREPDRNALFLLSDAYKIDPAWLMGYDVPMYLSDKIKDIESKVDILASTEITPNEKAMIIEFRKADEDTQKMIKRLLAYSESMRNKE